MPKSSFSEYFKNSKDKLILMGVKVSNSKTKIQNMLELSTTDNLTMIFTTPDTLVYDERTTYGCLEKCPNYNTRCFCPPFSLKYTEKTKSKKYAIIFARTIRIDNIKKDINNTKEKRKKNMSQAKKMLFYQKAEKIFQKQIKTIFRWWGLNYEDVFSAGFPLDKCDQCFKNEENRKRGIKPECFPMPAAEAFKVDIQKTMAKFNYSIDFYLDYGLTRIAMIFTDEPSCELFLGQIIAKNDKPLSISTKTPSVEDIKKLIITKYPDLELKLLTKVNFENHLKNDHHWLNLWDNAIMWKPQSRKSSITHNQKRSKKREYQKIKTEIHRIIFNAGLYFSHDYLIEDVFKEESITDGYYGIEFF